MKANILLISTRLIFDENTIFADAVRCECSSALKQYFYNASYEELRRLLGKIQKLDHPKECKKEETKPVLNKEFIDGLYGLFPEWLLGVDELTDENNNGDYQQFINTLYREITDKNGDSDYDEYIDIHKQILDKIKPYVGNSFDNNTKEKELPPFNYSIDNNGEDDFEKCLDYNAINIDQEGSSGLTIRDRISIYEIAADISRELSNEGKAQEVLYLIYAVWPLGNSDKDRDDGKKEYGKSEWVNQLARAVLSEASKKRLLYDHNTDKSINSIDNPEIVLLLHDHDIASQDRIPLRTIEINSDKIVEDQSNCTLAVFQHSNKEFIKLARNNIESKKANDIYDEARSFIVDELIFNLLTDFSEKLGLYTGSDDNDVIEDKVNCLKKYVKDKHDPKHYLELLEKIIYPSYIGNEYSALMIEKMSQYVNDMIKEITFPEKYSC